MPLLRGIRQSPAYLYVKAYCLCAVITLFQVAPVSSRLPKARETFQLDKIITKGLIPSSTTRNASEIPTLRTGERSSESSNSKPVSPPAVSRLVNKRSPPRTIVTRWYRRLVDLSQIKKQLKIDDQDFKTYPELNWDAVVRRSSSLHPEEERFIALRKHRISSQGVNSLHSFLNLPKDAEVDPRDVPLIALGGSGGGYRAMYGFTAFISASKKLGLWDCLTWTAGVSGSCWTLAAYYTIAKHDVSKLIRHYLAIAQEVAHPLSVDALNTVVRSSKGVYFLIGPLVRKVKNQSGVIGLGIMDLYGTLVTTYQFLSREPQARLSRATFQLSKIWTRSGIDQGLEPMPLFTAVRRAPRNSSGVKPHTDSSLSRGQPPDRALTQHEINIPDAITDFQRRFPDNVQIKAPFPRPNSALQIDQKPPAKKLFQWFEISPLEVGSPEARRFVPTWAYGRSFASGNSVGRSPEQSLSLLLGQCTSAPAGPLSGYISALLASMPTGTVMSRLLLLLNDFVRMKRWESTWGNPIRAGHEPNPFYGHNIPPLKDKPRWESEGRIRLMDGGMSNNLPNHILARADRCADVIIAFDASSDVQSDSAIRRLQNFADDCQLEIADETDIFVAPKARFQIGLAGDNSAEAKVESKFLHQYARVFRAKRENGELLYLVYCPLLPNGNNPGFDPSTASFSNSYNLVWTPEQIQTLLKTSKANLSNYSIDVIRQVVRTVWEQRKERRLNSSTLAKEESRNQAFPEAGSK